MCPICGKERVHRFRPFCSARCAEIDLGRWLTESYVIAGSEDEDALKSLENQIDKDNFPKN